MEPPGRTGENVDLRTWYAKQSEPLLKAGVNGWWNDEGEITYTTFYHWNEAELAAFNEAERPVHLPNDRWFPFEGATPQEGGQSISATAKLDEIPVYVRAGTILPLGPVVQNTDELPGGPLDLQIYPGKDTAFTFVEDDGDTTDYLEGAFRKTVFTWNDSARELSWTTTGSYAGPHLFKQMDISLFEPAGKKQVTAPFDATGSVRLPAM